MSMYITFVDEEKAFDRVNRVSDYVGERLSTPYSESNTKYV